MATHQPDCCVHCLVSTADTARAIVNDMKTLGVEPDNLGVVTRRETLVPDLPTAGIRERTGIVDAAKRGLVMGSIGGTITGLVAAVELPVSLLAGVALVALGCVAGTAFGIWASAMMGIEEPHRTIRPYESALDAGQVLIIMHVDHGQVEPIERLVNKHYPKATIRTAVTKYAGS